MEATENEFQEAAEAFVATSTPLVDPNVKRRNDLTQNLFVAVQAGAQARAHLVTASQRPGSDNFRDAQSWRQAEAQAQQALAALIEFEARLLT